MSDLVYKRKIFIGIGLLIAVALVALCMGRYMLPVKSVLNALIAPFGTQVDEKTLMIVLNVRLPRILTAMMIGAGLSVAGSSLQAVFSNPLAAPDTLGVSSGASFGAALGILLFANAIITQMMALLFGAVAIAATFFLSKLRGKTNILMIVLAGVIVAAFFTALVSCVKYVADPQSKLPEITFWLMGSMNDASYHDLLFGMPFILTGTVGILLLRWRLNILTLSEEEITSLGMKVKQIRWIIIIFATMIIGSSVSICGEVGWVGLVIPHIARKIVGNDYKKVVPACILIGAAYMLIIDTLCRTVSAAEIPLSILTAIIGAPVFAWLFFKKEENGIGSTDS